MTEAPSSLQSSGIPGLLPILHSPPADPGQSVAASASQRGSKWEPRLLPLLLGSRLTQLSPRPACGSQVPVAPGWDARLCE